MEKTRIIAVVCAIIACMLVVMAAKSCTESINETNKKNRNKATDASVYSSEASDIKKPDVPATREPIGYDLFGKPIYATEAAVPEEIQSPTDENGNVIEPVTEITTDEEGNVIEPVTEITTDEFGNVTETTESVQEPTTEFEYPTIPPGFSGYDHGEYDDDGNVLPTIPPDFVIVIN